MASASKDSSSAKTCSQIETIGLCLQEIKSEECGIILKHIIRINKPAKPAPYTVEYPLDDTGSWVCANFAMPTCNMCFNCNRVETLEMFYNAFCKPKSKEGL